jgi:hypothetical protein
MPSTNADTYYQISGLVRNAAFNSGGPVANPIGAGQDLEDAAAWLSGVTPTDREAGEVAAIIERLRYEGSFAQDYKDFARQPGFAARVTGLADRLDRLAGD